MLFFSFPTPVKWLHLPLFNTGMEMFSKVTKPYKERLRFAIWVLTDREPGGGWGGQPSWKGKELIFGHH